MKPRVPFCAGVVLAFFSAIAAGQEFESAFRGSPEHSQPVNDAASEPFVGVTTDGSPLQGLYSIDGPEGESNATLVQAATEFLNSLTREQRDKVLYPVDSDEWRRWGNTRPYVRDGIGFDELTEGQRDRAFDMMRAALSAKGFATSRDIMRLNESLAELSGNRHLLSEWFYWLTIMGEPSDTQPWGWQIDGHHLIINYFVLGNRVVMSPVFMGSEPVFADGGAYRGTTALVAEREKAFALYASLTAQQREAALLADHELPEPPGINFGRTSIEMGSDNAVLPYEGIRADSLSDEQRAILLGVIEAFITHNRESYADIRMRQIESHLDETHFAWNGWDASLGSEDLFFFRIQSPVVIIEFDHQGTIDIPGEPDDIPIRQHIHSIVRAPNGNDYGMEWLRQHYEQFPH